MIQDKNENVVSKELIKSLSEGDGKGKNKVKKQ